MAKDSEHYKKKDHDQKALYHELLSQLPPCARDYLRDKDLTTQVSTRISYAYDLLTFFRYIKNMNPCFKSKEIVNISYDDLQLFTSDDISEYQHYLEFSTERLDGEDHENGKRSIARKMAPLRGLYEYHLKHDNIIKNPMLLVPMPRIKKDKNIVRMTAFEVQDILDAIEKGNGQMSERQRKSCERTKQRDLAILTLMLGTGIRVSECVGLDVTDVDFKVNSLTIVRKGGGQDIVYFGDEVHQVLEDYIEGERKHITIADGQDKALFISSKGNRMSVDAIERLVKKYGRIAVPNKKITPHKLRSTYGTALYRETGDIRLVADVLGHENINTTIDYYAAIEDEHKRKAAGAVSLRNKKNESK
ncbi:MAG: tyrosine-type recombinase/integrase [Clostridium sp.]|jgi:site-specific recombinase XerD|nr:tyrosine-type recombinase/integrase [Clostridium sp.]DAO26453.1 MAG TPA: SITE SPECIFIC RECOMBINASE XERD [Inoviridae sp.]